MVTDPIPSGGVTTTTEKLRVVTWGDEAESLTCTWNL
jgi:hypothetical protein